MDKVSIFRTYLKKTFKANDKYVYIINFDAGGVRIRAKDNPPVLLRIISYSTGGFAISMTFIDVDIDNNREITRIECPIPSEFSDFGNEMMEVVVEHFMKLF
jgi:hypothetical protein